MKPLQLFLPLCTALFLSLPSADAQEEFIDFSSSWYLTQPLTGLPGGPGGSITEAYFFDSTATELEGQLYYQMLRSNEDTLVALDRYYREEAGKVYFYSSFAVEEALIYDFTASAGEVIVLGGGDSGFELEVEVLHVDSVMLEDGSLRKRMEISPLNSTITDYWVEGIGSYSATLDSREIVLLDGFTALNCFRSEEVPLLVIRDCELGIITSLSEEEPALSAPLAPNPTAGLVRLTDGRFFQYEVYTPQGQLLLSGQGYEIDLSAQPRGTYYIRLADGVRKVVKVE